MKKYQRDFIELSLNSKVLCIGPFVLKSGRKSPYFFNSGLFYSGKLLNALGRIYSEAIVSSELDFDIIYGPAYKGIPLVASVTINLNVHFNTDVLYAFNRKEEKDHGEGGLIVGASLENKKVLIVDDVITSGKSLIESTMIIRKLGGFVVGAMLALDRQEKGIDDISTIKKLQETLGFPVLSCIKFEDIIEYFSDSNSFSESTIREIEKYRLEYGA